MAKTAMKNRIKKMNFQRQEREMAIQPLSDNDKYILQVAGHGVDIRNKYENILRTTGRSSRPSYI
jgi:hypothetical protein|tara:strand:+ start:3857 stop:4051 length:195 start_codon:yes stop_codon:yes gene_type:complete